MKNQYLKNKSFYAEKSDGWFGTKEIKVYSKSDVDNALMELENEISELKAQLKLREFIECPKCHNEMQFINNTEYGCSNEDCDAVARTI